MYCLRMHLPSLRISVKRVEKYPNQLHCTMQRWEIRHEIRIFLETERH
uniref:Uncharacterized protein n=1 Tax=Anguilla anguilla TaxID=7936 RepID=A0A0E9SEJ1_ANGAN